MNNRLLPAWRGIGLIFILGVGVNYAWELAQTPLYTGVDFPGALWHCFVAALGDGMLILVIHTAVALVAASPSWYVRPAARTYVAMAAAGLVVGITVEWWGLHLAKRWQYAELMPIIPGLEVGLSPILQMLLLPPLIFGAVRRIGGDACAQA